ncbi:DUF2326 domain-containing protein [Vibrio vulnificus]|uniref:DUF2326 domain-containing protein n=1 Tax=Vibrio vulnificus TaxID=672 RepID=UPI003EDA816B
MIIKRLYSSDDSFFDPIDFENGLNLILGERSRDSEKRNGVGKSIAIEFINFCLLKDVDKSRLKHLPSEVLAVSPPIFLDIEIDGRLLKIKRDLKKPNDIVIYDGIMIHQLKLDDARNYLLSKIKFNKKNYFSTFRSLVNPITRDERCEFKSIPCYSDTNLKVPIDYTPHFFFLGIDCQSLNSAMQIKDDINSEDNHKRKVTNQIETLLGKSIKESRIEYNKLKEERDVLNQIVESGDYLAFDIFDEEYQKLDLELREIRIKLSSLRMKVIQSEKMISSRDIDVESVKIIYEKVRNGLGDCISKTIDEVISFKKKIDTYTHSIVDQNLKSINAEIIKLKERRDHLFLERNRLNSSTRDFKVEYDFKEVVGRLALKNELLNELGACLKRVDSLDKLIKRKKLDLDSNKLDIEILINDNEELLKSFEDNILNAHLAIFDEKSASFDIKVNNRKEIVEFELRIKEDGSHSNERAKIFIYDFSLLMHDRCYSNHLGFLIHDNIFDNDNDTLEKSINYINNSLFCLDYDAQYILTLNSDKLIGLNFDFDIDDYVRASFTKEDKFLKRDYKEVK